MLSAYSSSADTAAPDQKHWRQLAVLLEQNSAIAHSFLTKTPPAVLPTEQKLAALTTLASRQGLAELLDKHLLAALLLSSPDQRHNCSLNGRELINRLFPGYAPEPLLAAFWISVPILAVQGNTGQVITMLLGSLPTNTDLLIMGLPTPDSRAVQAINTACRVTAPDRGFACWFLQEEDAPPVRGNSLALPSALGCGFLIDHLSWPAGLYATGGLQPDGSIIAVAHVMNKYSAVAMSCRLFLMPADRALHPDTGKQSQACASFDDAWLSASLFSGGTSAAEILRWHSHLASAEDFFSSFHVLPLPMIKHRLAETLLHQACKAPKKYLAMLHACLNRCAHDRQRGRIISGLFTPDTILSLAGTTPQIDFAAYNWCLAVVAFHNHCGQVSQSRVWENCARQLYPQVDSMDIVKAINHAFVSSRFNRYDFRPDPEPEFAAPLQREQDKQKMYPESNYLLGAMYGTQAQNFGFCGPDYLESLLDMTVRARDAFGRKYDGEKERLTNYEIYGHLDQGNIQQARLLTAAYLNLGPFSAAQVWQTVLKLSRNTDQDSPFKAALALRLLSELTWTVPESGLSKITPLFFRQDSHPWQLSCLNLGRIAATSQQTEQATQLLRHSVRICLADSDTMHPMALLALAELHGIGRVQPDDLDLARKITAWINKTGRVNRDHFREILETTDAEELLHLVRNRRSVLFPFSYR